MGLRILITVLFLVLTASVSNAYTIVMRDGRRVEIPDEFNVTKSTLTYGVGQEIQITIQLAAVDIAATERANSETQGSFLLKANTPKGPDERAPQVRRATAGRSITNADLEKYRQARVESEKEYESRRRELGLPSLEERRREVAGIEDRTLEQVRSMRAQEEAYWRSRADALRAEMAVNQAQLQLRQPQGEIPSPYAFSSFPAFLPFDSVGFGITTGPFTGFRRFPFSPFSGFLSTPITPFPTFPVFRGHGRTPVFRSPGVRINPRPSHVNHGSRR
jgi:hypothetical protein